MFLQALKKFFRAAKSEETPSEVPCELHVVHCSDGDISSCTGGMIFRDAEAYQSYWKEHKVVETYYDGTMAGRVMGCGPERRRELVAENDKKRGF